jgi:hypothetical protein
MNLATLFLHNLRDGVCPAWIIRGGTREDGEKIHDFLLRHLAYEQDAGFNEWQFIQGDGENWYVRRFTWESSWYGTLDYILAKLANYYKS